jgi:hypothetical protein
MGRTGPLRQEKNREIAFESVVSDYPAPFSFKVFATSGRSETPDRTEETAQSGV